MIRIERMDTGDVDTWEGAVRACGGNPLHLPAVHLVDHSEDDVELLRFERDGDLLGCATAIQLRPGRLRRLTGKGTVLELPTAPAWLDEPGRDDLNRALFQHARAQGAARILAHPGYAAPCFSDSSLQQFRSSNVTEFVLDLRGGEERVLKSIHKNHRKNARRAARQGVQIHEEHDMDSLMRLRELQLASSDRASERAEGFGVPDADFFQRLHQQVYAAGTGRILFATLEGEIVAALAWLTGANKFMTVRSGSIPAGYESRAMYLLYDELIRLGLQEGRSELNAGGVPSGAAEPEHPQSGLYLFKEGFGGAACQRHGFDIDLKDLA